MIDSISLNLMLVILMLVGLIVFVCIAPPKKVKALERILERLANITKNIF